MTPAEVDISTAGKKQSSRARASRTPPSGGVSTRETMDVARLLSITFTTIPA
jgi:hypothetical protein